MRCYRTEKLTKRPAEQIYFANSKSCGTVEIKKEENLVWNLISYIFFSFTLLFFSSASFSVQVGVVRF